MREVSGVTGAAPIFRDVMLRLHRGPAVAFARPAGLERVEVCAASGRLPGPHCRGTLWEWFPDGAAPSAACDVHRVVAGRVYECWPAAFAGWMRANGIPQPPAAPREGLCITLPRDGDVFVLDPTVDRRRQALRLTASSPSTWWMDGRRLDGDEWPLAPGPHYLEARTEAGGRARVQFSVR